MADKIEKLSLPQLSRSVRDAVDKILSEEGSSSEPSTPVGAGGMVEVSLSDSDGDDNMSMEESDYESGSREGEEFVANNTEENSVATEGLSDDWIMVGDDDASLSNMIKRISMLRDKGESYLSILESLQQDVKTSQHNIAVQILKEKELARIKARHAAREELRLAAIQRNKERKQANQELIRKITTGECSMSLDEFREHYQATLSSNGEQELATTGVRQTQSDLGGAGSSAVPPVARLSAVQLEKNGDVNDSKAQSTAPLAPLAPQMVTMTIEEYEMRLSKAKNGSVLPQTLPDPSVGGRPRPAAPMQGILGPPPPRESFQWNGIRSQSWNGQQPKGTYMKDHTDRPPVFGKRKEDRNQGGDSASSLSYSSGSDWHQSGDWPENRRFDRRNKREAKGKGKGRWIVRYEPF